MDSEIKEAETVKKNQKNSFNKFNQREYDYEALEKEMLNRRKL